MSKRVAGTFAGLLFIGGGVLTLGYLFLPTPAFLDRGAVIAITVAAIALGAACLVLPWPRWPARAPLALVAPAFALIAAGNYFGSSEPFTFGTFFVVVFAWIGITQPRWTSTLVAVPAAVAYVAPILARPGSSGLGASSVVITIPVAILVGESLAWVAQRERRSHARTRALARISSAVGSHLSEEAVLEALVEEARLALGTRHALLVRTDAASRTIRRVHMAGIAPAYRSVVDGLGGLSYEGFGVREALERGTDAVVVEDAASSDLLPAELIRLIGARSFILIPLHVSGELVGVLACGESDRIRRFDEEDVVLATAIGAQARTAVRNAVLYERTREAATSDALTGLGNRAAFTSGLGDEIERARRYGRHLSLAVVDADTFKAINDAAGHLVGDRVLSQLAELLRRGLRGGDRAYRIGGDEFTLLLPETEPMGAVALAERVRRRVEQAALGLPDAGPLTISLGLATFPDHASEPEELFARADAMLYAAKSRGGNAVALARSDETDPEASLSGVAVRAVLGERGVVARYRPVVDLASGSVLAYEATCRLDPALGDTPLRTLAAAADDLGTLDVFEDLLREVALAGASMLPGRASLILSVSQAALERPTFDAARVAADVSAAGLDPGRVVVQLAELHGGPAASLLLRNLEACRRHGLRTAIEDVVRLADTSLLGAVPVDLLGVAVGGGPAAGTDRLLRAMRALATELGATPVAGGVDTPADLERAVALGFPAARGDLFGPPDPGFRKPEVPRVVRRRLAG